jgi:isoquinoline 1-oxidoreductase beta subunit
MTDRRFFLKAMAAAGGGLMLSVVIPNARARQSMAAWEANAVVRIATDGKVHLVMPYVEMGQGTYTSIPMLIAEELEVDLKDVVLEHAPPDDQRFINPALGFQVTGGSTTIRAAWLPMRQAGAGLMKRWSSGGACSSTTSFRSTSSSSAISIGIEV